MSEQNQELTLLQATLQQMQALSRQLIFTTLPDTTRRKRLTKKVLGLN
jgi:hypothetical protein